MRRRAVRAALEAAGATRVLDLGCGAGALLADLVGVAALDRLAAGEPLWRVHELVFAILAAESEPVDPRL